MKVLKLITRSAQYVAGVALIVIVVMQTSTIAGRFFFDHPISGVGEISSYMLMLIIALGLAGAAIERRHIKVDLVMDHLPKKAQFVIDTVMFAVSFIILGIMTWATSIKAMLPPRYTPELYIPDTPFKWAFVVGWGLCCISTLALVIENLRKRGKDGA